jgi:molybdopterin synthase catalytic subunit
MFKISNTPLIHSELSLKLEDERAGAMVFFDGRVRNHNEGHQVKSLEYQCYESMAIKVGKQIVIEALKRFEIHAALCVHRKGHLEISDVAVWVGVSSSHRQEAFDACQYIIDEVKSRVPMWKKEHYVERKAEWIECHRCSDHDHHGEAHA